MSEEKQEGLHVELINALQKTVGVTDYMGLTRNSHKALIDIIVACSNDQDVDWDIIVKEPRKEPFTARLWGETQIGAVQQGRDIILAIDHGEFIIKDECLHIWFKKYGSDETIVYADAIKTALTLNKIRTALTLNKSNSLMGENQ